MNLRWVERKVPDERMIEGMGWVKTYRTERVLQTLEPVLVEITEGGMLACGGMEWVDVPVEAE